MPGSLALESHARLVERERELSLIEDVLAAAARGRGALVLVEGEAGIGKTALLSAAARRARAGRSAAEGSSPHVAGGE